MNSEPSQCSSDLLPSRLSSILTEAGVYRFGIARAESVDPAEAAAYGDWIGRGCHAGMDYLDRYADVRSDPRLLLPGASSLIVCAFPYACPMLPEQGKLRIASYALGDDYHEVVRKRLRKAAAEIDSRCGSVSRVCVDTAPLRERYWAVRAGLGFIGLNGQLILPDAGSYFFIGIIITTLALPPSEPCRLRCLGCRRCIIYCPGQAIASSGRPEIDARRCLSYLTIEHRGPFTVAPHLGNRVYGCDTCQTVCPHNIHAEPVEPLPEFQPRPALLNLTRSDILGMNADGFSQLFRHSAVKRAGLSGLQRNASACD